MSSFHRPEIWSCRTRKAAERRQASRSSVATLGRLPVRAVRGETGPITRGGVGLTERGLIPG